MNILLIGNPNVGKSVIFSRLTGVRVIVSNYPGTTVEVKKGVMRFLNIKAQITDVPGTYSLTAANKAEEVALKLIGESDAIINVIDATNLERNLRLTLDLIRKVSKPIIIVLNMWDETKHLGIEIDIEKLSQLLGVPVVATCGLTGEGIKDLVYKINTARTSPLQITNGSLWSEIGDIVEAVQRLHPRRHTFLDVLEGLSIKAPFSFFIAVAVIGASFSVIRFVAESLITYVFTPFFTDVYNPLILGLSRLLGEGGLMHSLLIGNLSAGNIDYSRSFGLLTTGIYVPVAMVLPYIFSFYLILSLLEDWGYLPRLAVLADRLFHRLGLHGYAIIPMILGLGCNVPGALALRLFGERREKFIAATLLAVAVPCMAQIAMIIGLLGPAGGQYVLFVFTVLFCILQILGRLMHKFLPGPSPEILIEIPPYRCPHLFSIIKKLWMRIGWFFKEAIPLVLMGILLINLLYFLKAVDFLANIFTPVIRNLWGLPREVIGALIVGFLRKDVAVAMLRPLDLSLRQMVVGATILSIYFPCAATFFVLLRELGLKDMLKSVLIMMATTTIVGAILNFMLSSLGWS